MITDHGQPAAVIISAQELEDLEDQLALAQYQAARGDRNGALQIYRQVIDRFPNDSARARAFVLSAIVQLDAGDSVSACRSVASTDSLAVADRFLVSKMEQIGAICPPPDASGDSVHKSNPPGDLR